MIKSVAEDLWVAEGELKAPAGMTMTIRSTLIRLDGHNLMVISPIEPTEKLIQDVKALGTVKYIVAPNGMHHLYVNKFAAFFPDAEIWGPVDLHAKRNDIRFQGVLEADVAMPWEAFVEKCSVKARAPMCEEFVFFHLKSRTVILTDLMFNFHHFDNWLMVLIAKLNGGYKRLAMTRLGRMYFNKAASLKAGTQRILDWQPENLIVAHGDIIQGGASAPLAKAIAKLF